MARARNIKPGFFKNEDLVDLPFETRLLFIGLWTLADREGRLENRPKRIKMELFPADNVDIENCLRELTVKGFIGTYEVDGVSVIQIVNFTKHQSPHHTEKASDLPSANGELTVKQPLKTREPQKGLRGNPPDSLNPDSLIPDSLNHETQNTSSTSEEAEQSPNGGVCVFDDSDQLDQQPSIADAPTTTAGAIAAYCRSQGVNASPSASLKQLIEQGATMSHFVDAVPIAKERQKGFNYVLGIVKQMIADEQAAAQQPPARASPRRTKPEKFDPIAHNNRNRIDSNGYDRQNHIADPANIIDITPEGEPVAPGNSELGNHSHRPPF